MSEPTEPTEVIVSTDLPGHVHGAELRTIKARREAADIDAREIPDAEEQVVDPAVERDLIGLAISGGGIRSSTFSLGVIQTLERKGLFKRFDYISTVSGGGYTGSMLSTLLRRKRDAPRAFPLAKPRGEEEPRVLQHLRNGSNYLSPGGLMDTLRLPAVIVRGLLLNVLLVLPALMFAVYLTELVHEKRYVIANSFGAAWSGFTEFFLTIPGSLDVAVVVLIGLWGFYRLMILASRGVWEFRNRHEKAFGLVLLLGGIALVMVPLVHATRAAIQLPYSSLTGFLTRNLSLQIWMIALAAVILAYGLVKASQSLSHVVSKLMLYGAAVAGPGILFGLYLLLLVAQVDSPFIDGSYPELASPQPAARVSSVAMSDSLRADFAGKGVTSPAATFDAQSFGQRFVEWGVKMEPL